MGAGVSVEHPERAGHQLRATKAIADARGLGKKQVLHALATFDNADSSEQGRLSKPDFVAITGAPEGPGRTFSCPGTESVLFPAPAPALCGLTPCGPMHTYAAPLGVGGVDVSVPRVVEHIFDWIAGGRKGAHEPEQRIDFGEFLDGVADFCSLSRGRLIRLCFALYATTRHGTLTRQNIVDLVADMLGISDPEHSTQAAMRKVRRGGVGGGSLRPRFAQVCQLDERSTALALPWFEAFVKQQERVLYPLFALQLKVSSAAHAMPPVTTHSYRRW